MELSVKAGRKFPGFSLDMEFTARSGRLGILGASGSGKSMCLRMLAGILRPDEGRICYNERTFYDGAAGIDLRSQDRNVGYLFQNYALFPTMTVAGNIACAVRGSRAEREERVSEMLSRFRLSGLSRRYPAELSGGQQQRVALARIMAYRPELILLDEPFSALDVYLKDQMQAELTEQLADYDGMVILVSHSRDEIYRFSSELLIVENGRIEEHGGTRELFKAPGRKVTARLTGCKNFSRAERCGEHAVRALDWGILIRTKREIPEDIRFIGYRAHDFLPVWEEDPEKEGGGCGIENAIPVGLKNIAELPFERNYYFRPLGEGASPDVLLSCFLQRERWKEFDERGIPRFLKLAEEKILFLR